MNNYLHVFCHISFGQGYLWRNHVVEAGSDIAVGADKMYMIVVMMVFVAIAAQGIAHRIIGSRYGMHNAFFLKCLQGAVNGYPVELFTGFFFNITMGQRIVAAHKKGQYFFAAVG